jgi:tRNA pseudouridine55 synthase
VALVAKPGGPNGPTSHDVVDTVRGVVGTDRVGHLGTLDPFAAGLLVILVGRATRLAPFAAGWAKAYDGVIRLGTTTATDDATGATVATSEAWRGVDRTQVEQALAAFRGGYDQRPPAYSAVKVAGERAYRRARRGEDVALQPRRVQVTELELERFAPPDVGFRATVGGGTYLRSLARDLGEALGCGAHLATLTRTQVGRFRLADAVPPEVLTAQSLCDPAELVRDLPGRELDDAGRAAVVHGRPVAAGDGTRETGNVALFWHGQLVAVAERVGEMLKPRVVVVER